MARSLFTIQHQLSFKDAQKKIERILKRKKFDMQLLNNGELVWQRGKGVFTAMKFIKVDYAPNQIQLYAWIQMGSGTSRGRELGLRGISGVLPKMQLFNLISGIKKAF
jgi:hypothetical protein